MKYAVHTPYTPMQKLRGAIGALVSIILLGTLFFIVFEEMPFLDALYMTVITISTVGYGEVQPLHLYGKVFVITLILASLAIGAFLASVIGQLALEGQLQAIFGRKKMENKIRKLKNHIIIAGYGRVGRQVAQEFQKKRVPYVVIEAEEQAVRQLIDEGILFVEGNATDDEVLRKAGIETAGTLVSTLPDEAHNVYLTLTARDINKNLKIIARADFDDGEKKLVRAGADHVVSPHILGGQRMALASLRPNVVDFMQMTALGEEGLSIEEVVIPSGCKLSGLTLVESKLKQEYGVTIVGIKQSEHRMIITPGPNTVLNEGDVLVIIGPTEKLEQLTKDLG